MLNPKATTYLLLAGIAGSVLVGIGEYLLHFLPQGPGGEIAMLEDVPLSRASKGHFFAVYGAPLYFAGYYGLMKVFYAQQKKLAYLLFSLGVLAFFIGGIWISSRYFGAEVLQRTSGTPDHVFFLESYEKHYQSLVWSLRIIVAAISVVYIVLILNNKQGFPKWLAIFNPIILLIITISSLVWFKALGVHIAPIAMNVTHFIFFTSILYFRNKTQFNHEVV